MRSPMKSAPRVAADERAIRRSKSGRPLNARDAKLAFDAAITAGFANRNVRKATVDAKELQDQRRSLASPDTLKQLGRALHYVGDSQSAAQFMRAAEQLQRVGRAFDAQSRQIVEDAKADQRVATRNLSRVLDSAGLEYNTDDVDIYGRKIDRSGQRDYMADSIESWKSVK